MDNGAKLNAETNSGYDIAKYYPIDYSQKRAYVIGNSGKNAKPKLYELTSPAEYSQTPLCIALINHLNQTQTDDTRSNYAKYRMIARFFEWLSEKSFHTSELPADIIKKYSDHLQENDAKQSTQCEYIAKLRVYINWGMNSMYSGPNNTIELLELTKIYAFIPSIPNRRESTHESLSQITECSCHDELLLIRSVIRFCCFFLKMINDFRTTLLESPNVQKSLKSLLDSCKGDTNKLRWATKNTKFKTLYKSIADAILESSDIRLKEYFLSNRKSFVENLKISAQPLTLSDANTYIKNGLTSKGNLEYANPLWPAPFLFTNLDFLFLIKPTPSEEICMSWLLAADRVQLSGIESLQMHDILITSSSASVAHIKRRSSEIHKETLHHRHDTLQYRSLAIYFSTRQSYLNLFPHAGNHVFDNANCASLQVLDSDIFRPIIVAALPHTTLYKSMKSEHSEITAFAEIIENVAKNNSILQEKSAIATALRTDLNSNKDSIKRLETIKQKIAFNHIRRQSITANKIGQSRAILDDYPAKLETDNRNQNIPLTTSSDQNYDKYSQQVVGAEATSHTLDVKQKTYLNRSTTKYRWDKRASFASAAGSLMEADARKITQLRDANKYITIDELQIELGWKKDLLKSNDIEKFDAVIEKLQKEGWAVTPFGELEMNGHRIIIVSPVEAALLITYRIACNKRLEELSEYETDRGSALVMQIAYIEAVLEKFDRKTILEGEKIVSDYDLPLPIIR